MNIAEAIGACEAKAKEAADEFKAADKALKDVPKKNKADVAAAQAAFDSAKKAMDEASAPLGKLGKLRGAGFRTFEEIAALEPKKVAKVVPKGKVK
jgi:hypothetical protein